MYKVQAKVCTCEFQLCFPGCNETMLCVDFCSWKNLEDSLNVQVAVSNHLTGFAAMKLLGVR